MDDKHLDDKLTEISSGVQLVAHRVGGSWYALFRGILAGFGSVVGAFLAIILIGWVLNLVGVIPAFKNEAEDWKKSLQSRTPG